VKWLLLNTLLSILLVPATWRAWRALQLWPRIPVVDALVDADRAPAVAVLVPARDEERGIERCVRSLLAQHYRADRLRIVVVDDESSDRTVELVRALARTDERLHLVRGTRPPTGWLGKAWALHQGLQQVDATSEYLLFTDADTVHEPNALASAVAHLQRHRLNLLSLGTGQELVGPAERLLLPFIIGLAMVVNGTFDEVNDPRRPERAKANGQFILISASAYARIGGHAAVRGAVVEDFELARRAKRLGLRLQLADGRHLVRTRGYYSAREIWRGFAKNALAEACHEPVGAAAALVGIPVVGLGPYVLLALALTRLRLRKRRVAAALLCGQAALQVGHLIGFTTACSTALGLPARYGFAQPIATLFVWLLLVTAVARRACGKPAMWKGRPVDQFAR
jgi:chlorobactene glucosyltransferase